MKSYPVAPAYLPTPGHPPDATDCRVFHIPAASEWFELLTTAVSALTDEWRWYQSGSMSPAEAAAAWEAILDDIWLNIADEVCPDAQDSVPTPFWDEDTEVDDQADVDEQSWYGYVTDPEADPAELDFVENAAIWAMTGFLAAATWELGAAPAILFHTIAPRFVLAMRRGDVGEVIRILVDGEEVARLDTTDTGVGDVVEVPIVADPSITAGHDLMIVQVS